MILPRAGVEAWVLKINRSLGRGSEFRAAEALLGPGPGGGLTLEGTEVGNRETLQALELFSRPPVVYDAKLGKIQRGGANGAKEEQKEGASDENTPSERLKLDNQNRVLGGVLHCMIKYCSPGKDGRLRRSLITCFVHWVVVFVLGPQHAWTRCITQISECGTFSGRRECVGLTAPKPQINCVSAQPDVTATS